MNNLDLLNQYASTGAFLDKYQVDKLPRQALRSYLRRRILQAAESTTWAKYHLNDYEFEHLSNEEKHEYIEKRFKWSQQNNTLTLYYFETPYLTDAQIVKYVRVGGDYPVTNEQKDRILRMEESYKQEYLLVSGKVNHNIFRGWELEFMDMETFQFLCPHIVKNNNISRMPEKFHREYIKVMIEYDLLYSDIQLINMLDNARAAYLDALIKYAPDRISNYAKTHMSEEQLVRYKKRISNG